MAEGEASPAQTPIVKTEVSAPETDPLQNLMGKLETAGGFGENHTPIDSASIDTDGTDDKEIQIETERPIIPHIYYGTPNYKFLEELKRNGILPKTHPTNPHDLGTDDDYERAGYHLIRPYGPGLFLDKERINLPELAIIYLPSREDCDKYIFLDMVDEYWNIPYERRPAVILYADKFELPINQKHHFDGFLFASTPEELQKVVRESQDIIRNKKAKSFDPEELAPEQEKSYDESEDLREWEGRTADTYQSLKLLFEGMNRRLEPDYTRKPTISSSIAKNNNFKSSRIPSSEPPPVVPSRAYPIRTFLDVGTGEGRIAIPLARLGYKVMGIDISQEMLNRGKTRQIEEGKGLRHESESTVLSYNALLRLQTEGLLPLANSRRESRKMITDDQEAEQNYIRVKGDFFNLYRDLALATQNWALTGLIEQKKINIIEFLGINTLHPFFGPLEPSEILQEQAFDKIVCMWNTFWEVGDKKNQDDILRQFYWLTNPGGEVTIEIADRNSEPYISEVEDYHHDHPDEPYGTIQDKKPDEKGLFPKRYLSDVKELATLLKAKGFSIRYWPEDLEQDNPESDVRVYFIENTDQETGEKKRIKVYQVTAHKK